MEPGAGTAEDFFKLGIQNFKNSDYQSAINAFRKSIALKEDWRAYQGLGSALKNTQQFQEAIDAFRKSISLREYWYSYQGLGWALFKTQQFVEATNVFRKSIALKENWNSYQGLGWVLINTSQFAEAIDVFRKSIALQEDWNSYQGLALALNNTQQFVEAIDVFRKSIALKEDWSAYQGLGWALFNTQQFVEATYVFRKSIAIKEDFNSYQGLGWALFNTQEFVEATYSFIGSWHMSKDKKLLKTILSLIAKSYPGDYNFLSELLNLPNPKTLADTKIDKNYHSISSLSQLKGKLNTGLINPLIIWYFSVHSKSLKGGTDYDNQDLKTSDPIITNETELSEDKLLKVTRSKNILSFGDSHGRIFMNHRFIKHFPLKAGTAYNINNPNSSSGSHNKIIDTIKDYKPDETTLIFTFGEIDLRAHVHKQSRIQNRLPELIVNDIVSNYFDFFDQLLSTGYTLLVNAPHCGGGEQATSVPVVERNDMCSHMNGLLMAGCRDRSNIRCASLYDIGVNLITRKNRVCFLEDSHHFYLPFNLIGKSLQKILINRFINYTELDQNQNDSDDEINAVCRILASNITGCFNLSHFITGNILKYNQPIEDNDSRHVLIELPFPILVNKITQEFKLEEKNIFPSSFCQAIYESCDPMLIPKKNVFKGASKTISNNIEKSIQIEHDFSEYKFNNMHTRYIFFSISNSKGTTLRKISVSRMRFS